MRYARDVSRSVLDYRLPTLGIAHRPEYEVPPSYAIKRSSLASHSQIAGILGP